MHARACDGGIGRERDHWNAASARDLCGGAHRDREERPEDDLGALGECLLRCLLCTAGVAAVVLHQKLDVGIGKFRERHFGSIAHRAADRRAIAGSREWQDQRDLYLAGADLTWLRGRRWRLRVKAEIIRAGNARARRCEQRQRRHHRETRGARPPHQALGPFAGQGLPSLLAHYGGRKLMESKAWAKVGRIVASRVFSATCVPSRHALRKPNAPAATRLAATPSSRHACPPGLLWWRRRSGTCATSHCGRLRFWRARTWWL